MTLRSLLESVEPPARTLAVVDGESESENEAADPLEGLLAETFAETGIDVETGACDPGAGPRLEGNRRSGTSDDAGSLVVLLEDGEPIAASSMQAVYESVLAINSDLFTTGARGLGEIELPDVLAGLADTRLRLRGYPLAHREKLLLILLSRYVEQLAWRADGGTLRVAFQRLSRIDDEVGTREVYAELEDAPVDVHVYGAPPADESAAIDELDVAAHAGTSAEYRNWWFVVHSPADPTAPEASPAALLCHETEPRIWDGFWTFDSERVTALEEYVATEL